MKLSTMLIDFNLYNAPLEGLSSNKLLITTLNAYSYIITQKDGLFKEALQQSDVLLPDGISVVWVIRWLTGKKVQRRFFYYQFILH